MKKNILIVEDETIVAMEIESYLRSLNYNVIATCSTADCAYQEAICNDVDLVLMDIFLIDSNGIEATSRIKKVKPDLPIIFLSAFMDEDTITKAIEVNPQAYLMKPFNHAELEVAIKIGLKHNEVSQKDETKREGNIYLNSEFSFNTQSSQLIFCGETVNLTKKERTLLQLFLKNPNALVSIESIEYELWPDKPTNDGRRRSLISRLRAKLKHQFIETYSSEGYTFKLLS